MNRLLSSLLALLFLLGVQGAAQGQAHLTAKLTGPQEVPSVATAATGTAWLTLTSGGVSFYVTVNGLSGPIIAAHIHNAQAGTNGGVVRTLTGDFVGNTGTGIWTAADAEPLTPALITQLMNGNCYVNVHTAANPGGEIRGQITRATPSMGY
jgi:CHRD domain-containing protein